MAEVCDPTPLQFVPVLVNETVPPFVANCQLVGWIFGGVNEPVILYLAGP